MVFILARYLPRITNAQFRARADLEVHARFDQGAVFGDRYALGAERSATIDEGQVGVGLGVAEGMAPADGRTRGELPAVVEGDDLAGTQAQGGEGDVLIGIGLQAPDAAFFVGGIAVVVD